MEAIRRGLFLLLSVLCCGLLQARQKSRYNTYRYSVNEGLLQSSVLDLAVDEHNFSWLAFSNGIQRFDGISFKTIPVQAGLPDDKNVEFYKQSNAVLLFEHSGGISKYCIKESIFKSVFNLLSPLYKPFKIIGEWNGMLCVYDKQGFLHYADPVNYTIVKTVALPVLKRQDISKEPLFSNIKEDYIGFHFNNRFYQYHLREQKLSFSSAIMEPPTGAYLQLEGRHELLYFHSGNRYGLQKYNFQTGLSSTVFAKPPTQWFYRGVVFNWRGSRLMSYFDKLYFMSADLTRDSSEILDFKNNSIIGNSTVIKIVADNFDNLYLVTINDGIRKIIRNGYPLRFYGSEHNNGTYALGMYADKINNRIVVGTNSNGIQIFDSMQNLIKHIVSLPGEEKSFSANTITRTGKGEYIFTAPGKYPVYKLSASLSFIQALPVAAGDKSMPVQSAAYFSNLLYDDEVKAILQTQFLVYVLDKRSNVVKQYQLNGNASHGGLLFNGKLIVHSNDAIQVYDTAAFKLQQNVPFLNTSRVRCYSSNAGKIYLGSNKGVFVIDENFKIIQQYNRSNGLPDECIYAMQFDSKQNLWCSTNKGIIRISPAGQIFQLTKEDGLQENEFNNNATFKSADGELYFGGVSGVNSFYPGQVLNHMTNTGIYITDIKVNNQDLKAATSYQSLQNITLSHDKNSVAIAFVASGPQHPMRYIHQYKMDGLEKDWLQQPPGEPARYVLPPGNYVFKMYASASFDNAATAIKELHIKVRPPFWKTWWFLGLLGIATLGILMYVINRINKMRYQKRLASWLMMQKVQEERERISMELHDSIGAYANAVLYNTELLQNKQEEQERQALMKDLRFASKDIITSLRETIWALKNENYTAQECMMRIRNFVHPFSRYYPTIHFKIEGEVPEQKALHYSTALAVVRIVQEAVNNAIKHGQPQNIIIRSSLSGNTWLLNIADDGNGFRQDAVVYGNGIMNMKKRAEDAGIVVNVVSAPEEGTRVTIVIT